MTEKKKVAEKPKAEKPHCTVCGGSGYRLVAAGCCSRPQSSAGLAVEVD